MIKVSEYYNRVNNNYGKSIASKFYSLMKEWDRRSDVWNSFYDEDLLKIKLKEANENK